MKTVAQFIKEQPASRKVDFNKSDVTSGRECGCLLIHYAREVLGLRGEIHAYMNGVAKSAEDNAEITVPDEDFTALAVHYGIRGDVKTYGELRELLEKRNAFPAP